MRLAFACAGFALFCNLCFGAAKVELGEINGAKFRIDVPENWNGGLVLYCHGYATVPAKFDDAPKPNAPFAPFLAAGFAVAQSGYSAIGWAIQEAIDDTQALRRYFIARYGKPKEVFISGQDGVRIGFNKINLVVRSDAQVQTRVPVNGQQPVDAFAGLHDVLCERWVEIFGDLVLQPPPTAPSGTRSIARSGGCKTSLLKRSIPRSPRTSCRPANASIAC